MRRLTPSIVGTVIAAAGVWSTACAARTTAARQSTVDACPPGQVANYMAARAQQCWYISPAGRWRIVNHEFHYDNLVVDTVASSPDMSDEITRRLTAVHGERFSEIVIYVRLEPGLSPAPASIRRVRWTAAGGVEQLDFTALQPGQVPPATGQ